MKKEKRIKEVKKEWKFKNKKETVDFFITALSIQTPYPKIVELIQPNKVRITKVL